MTILLDFDLMNTKRQDNQTWVDSFAAACVTEQQETVVGRAKTRTMVKQVSRSVTLPLETHRRRLRLGRGASQVIDRSGQDFAYLCLPVSVDCKQLGINVQICEQPHLFRLLPAQPQTRELQRSASAAYPWSYCAPARQL